MKLLISPCHVGLELKSPSAKSSTIWALELERKKRKEVIKISVLILLKNGKVLIKNISLHPHK
jgi:hypothetical protein